MGSDSVDWKASQKVCSLVSLKELNWDAWSAVKRGHLMAWNWVDCLVHSLVWQMADSKATTKVSR
jgi:hypothetical protein